MNDPRPVNAPTRELAGWISRLRYGDLPPRMNTAGIFSCFMSVLSQVNSPYCNGTGKDRLRRTDRR